MAIAHHESSCIYHAILAICASTTKEVDCEVVKSQARRLAARIDQWSIDGNKHDHFDYEKGAIEDNETDNGS